MLVYLHLNFILLIRKNYIIKKDVITVNSHKNAREDRVYMLLGLRYSGAGHSRNSYDGSTQETNI